MKFYSKKAMIAALVATTMLASLSNCSSKKSDNKAALLAALLFLNNKYNNQNATTGENVCDGLLIDNAGSPETISGDITADRTLQKNHGYLLSGTVFVRNNATLNVPAGAVIFGQKGSSLFVLQGSKLNVSGTKDAPVCFTSSQYPGSRQPGDWGGVVLIGNAIGTKTSQTEGTTPQTYGSGTNDNDGSGVWTYAIVEFAGYEVAPGDELNAISMYTIGNATTFEHVQMHRGLDDGIENWGGAWKGKYLISTGNLDDQFDIDQGFHGEWQYLIDHQFPTVCGGSVSSDPRGMEMNGLNNKSSGSQHASGTAGTDLLKYSYPNVSNFTAIGQKFDNSAGLYAREAMNGKFSHGYVYNFSGPSLACVAPTTAAGLSTAPEFYDVKTDSESVTSNACSGTSILKTGTDTSALTALPIVTDGDLANTCGLGPIKPDYSAASSQSGSATVGTIQTGRNTSAVDTNGAFDAAWFTTSENQIGGVTSTSGKWFETWYVARAK